jgi:hypothetical protein
VIIILIAMFFRYDKEEIGIYQLRQDRFTGKIEFRVLNSKWNKLGLKSMQQAKAYFQQQEIQRAVDNALGK